MDKRGVSADPEKTSAIKSMKAPVNFTQVKQFLGMVNQLGKFSPNLATE